MDAYKEVLEVNKTQRIAMMDQLRTLQKRRDEQRSKLDILFKAMQTREGQIGYGLIHTKTGHPIPDMSVEMLLRRQKNQMGQVATMRLNYIKLKGMVQEKLDAIEKLEQLGNNYRLADYEQLKAENRTLADRIEERDEELVRIRAKCQNTVQVLAHLREKTYSLESDIQDLKYDLEGVETEADRKRLDLADLKHERDYQS